MCVCVCGKRERVEFLLNFFFHTSHTVMGHPLPFLTLFYTFLHHVDQLPFSLTRRLRSHPVPLVGSEVAVDEFDQVPGGVWLFFVFLTSALGGGRLLRDCALDVEVGGRETFLF